ncbi:hypothetical protein SAMD00023378_1811 [Ralstonia sp. NT80]|nr:hypothetical protein SAMD00023378_1811 [Ralstonia sp. NT80]
MRLHKFNDLPVSAVTQKCVLEQCVALEGGRIPREIKVLIALAQMSLYALRGGASHANNHLAAPCLARGDPLRD